MIEILVEEIGGTSIANNSVDMNVTGKPKKKKRSQFRRVVTPLRGRECDGLTFVLFVSNLSIACFIL